MEEDEDRTEGRGRSEKKRQAQAIAKLAERLVELPGATVTSLPLDEDLREELMQLRRIKSRSAKKRALKHFAGQLRGDDEAREKVQAALSQRDVAHGQDTAHHQALEQLRERLCSADEKDAALQEVATNYPSVDRKALLRLINAVLRGRDKAAYREIFRRLREGKASQLP